ncbi:hypothetical protein J3R83DRAFT_3965, partial [Lanmaoa asiatica]
ILDSTHCNYSINVPSRVEIYYTVPRFVLAALLLILAVIQALKQSIDMYKATEHWQPNQCMKSLVKEGTIYFFLCVSL